ncbi:MAG: SH3 domain-containing protein [Anaerolineales bacterium]
MATEVSGDELAAVEATIAAMETELASVQETETHIPTASATPEPSATPTATPVPARISVSEATNCRSGPDPSFELLGVLTVGREADVVGESNDGDYWYIVNPDDPEGYCWLLSEYASIDGETEGLPVHTPAPTPTPSVGFDVWFHGFASCGDSDLVIFAVRNGGSVRLWSGWLGVYTIENSEPVYGPVKERHPFSKSALETCPPGHGNELYPGEVNYIFMPLKSMPSETDAYAEFKLCSADHGGGDCVTKIGYFHIP